ncbi:Asparagine synthetase [glutamine-hydrolyzing] 2 [Candidatus Cardinium hertigii]|uniref:asparagine synthase (glutamine-hydrolyzing) n=2 Tax=Candidatus Cardinium hertigii TaxID=247481 RepID=A0A2Z3L846_9BACT|nr:Asparagine synthetase [glutamine-hydrolyzing] 2 [Candidatus Cardinium hertigii]
MILLKNKLRDLQMYNLWQEDRLAACVGLENRVPFLNDLVLKVILGIPRSLHAKLFWNKYILRNAFKKELGHSVAHRPKVALFYGQGQNNTIKMMLRLMSMHNFALVDLAYPNSHANSWLNKAHLKKAIQQLMMHPPYKGWEKVLRLINIGILEQMHCGLKRNYKKINYRMMHG